MTWHPEIIKNPKPLKERVVKERRVIPMILQRDRVVVMTFYKDKDHPPTAEIRKVQIIQGGKKISARTIS
jgi:hypothetical protein